MKRVQIILLVLFLYSCSDSNKNDDSKQFLKDEDHFQLELSEWDIEKDEAFDALDEIQVNGGYLFSTFPGIEHRCFPADTSFTITSEEFQIALEGLLAKYYDNIPEEKRIQLSIQASLAQKDYLVLACYGFKKEAFLNVKEALPRSGKWILPEVQSLRDVVISWD